MQDLQSVFDILELTREISAPRLEEGPYDEPYQICPLPLFLYVFWACVKTFLQRGYMQEEALDLHRYVISRISWHVDFGSGINGTYFFEKEY